MQDQLLLYHNQDRLQSAAGSCSIANAMMKLDEFTNLKMEKHAWPYPHSLSNKQDRLLCSWKNSLNKYYNWIFEWLCDDYVYTMSNLASDKMMISTSEMRHQYHIQQWIERTFQNWDNMCKHFRVGTKHMNKDSQQPIRYIFCMTQTWLLNTESWYVKGLIIWNLWNTHNNIRLMVNIITTT